MYSSLNIVFNFKQNTQPYIVENDVRPAIDFKIIRLARVRFEFETPVLDESPAAGSADGTQFEEAHVISRRSGILVNCGDRIQILRLGDQLFA
jgi:hypothetical protein